MRVRYYADLESLVPSMVKNHDAIEEHSGRHPIYRSQGLVASTSQKGSTGNINQISRLPRNSGCPQPGSMLAFLICF